MKDFAKTLLKLVLGRGTFRSYSQFGEDALVNSLFRNKKYGIYVDVGAYHPILYSNTYALYRRGWRGFAIDPNPSLPPPLPHISSAGPVYISGNRRRQKTVSNV